MFTAHVTVVLIVDGHIFVHGRTATSSDAKGAAISLALTVDLVPWLWERPTTCRILETGETLPLPGRFM